MMGLYFRELMVGETMLKPLHRHQTARLLYLIHMSATVGYAPAKDPEKAAEGYLYIVINKAAYKVFPGESRCHYCHYSNM